MPTLETPPNSAPPSTGAPPTPPNPLQLLKVSTRRFGELEEHELIHLLDSIDDEIARARFRESIYVSIIICLAFAWLAVYGPRFLFHQGRIASPKEEVTELNRNTLPSLPLPRSLVHKAPPRPVPAPQPRAEAAPAVPETKPQPQPAPSPRPQPQPPEQRQPTPQPPAPQPRPSPNPSTALPDAPRPSASATSRPNFGTPESPGQSNRDAANAALHGGGSGISAPSGRGGLDSGAQLISDPMGADFGPWFRRIKPIVMGSWTPLIPEECAPPLNKTGWTQIRITFNHDGTIADMHLEDSSHDTPIDRAAWGGITGVGQFPPLPKDYKAPTVEMRFRFSVGREGDDAR